MNLKLGEFTTLEKEHWERYLAAMHAVQTAVAYEINSTGEDGAGATPKHLRMGVNSALLNDDAFLTLLMEKGVFTREEYIRAIADSAEREKVRYENDHPGIKFA